MISASNYPLQRYVIPLTTLNREVLLPEGVKGTVLANKGQRVDGNTIVVRGYLPARHHILDIADGLRLRRRQAIDEFLLVEQGDVVEAEQAVASRRQDPERGRRVFSPVNGVVASIVENQIVVREHAEQLELSAGLAGQVTETIERRGVIIQSSGAVVQGVWGNGKRGVGALKLEPEDGMEFIESGAINLDWRGSIVVTTRPLTTTNFTIMEEQDIAGVIAPSMDSTLVDIVSRMDRAVLLTEGFGAMPMSNVVHSLLEKIIEENFNVRATIDAIPPNQGVARRPEVIVGVKVKAENPPRLLAPSATLRKNSRVRITRAPYGGQAGVIRELPRTPLPIGNGLSVPAAIVELGGGDQVNIPLANLEIYDVT